MQALVATNVFVQPSQGCVKNANPLFLDMPSSFAAFRRGAFCKGGAVGRAYQKGCVILNRHRPLFFVPSNRLGNWLAGCIFLSGGTLMDQREFPLLGRLDAPSTAPTQWVIHAKSYRQAVRLSWQLKRVSNLTRQQLATEAQLYPQHVTDYLHEDDKASRRDLPADAISRFEAVVGNTLVTQWLANKSHLTVLEEIQATNQRKFA